MISHRFVWNSNQTLISQRECTHRNFGSWLWGEGDVVWLRKVSYIRVELTISNVRKKCEKKKQIHAATLLKSHEVTPDIIQVSWDMGMWHTHKNSIESHKNWIYWKRSKKKNSEFKLQAKDAKLNVIIPFNVFWYFFLFLDPTWKFKWIWGNEHV